MTFRFALAVIVLVLAPAGREVSAQESATPPSLKIVKLLWKAQPAGAGAALEKAIDQALTREQTSQLKPHLQELSDKFKPVIGQEPTDARWLAALGALAITEDAAALELVAQAVAEGKPELEHGKREFLLRCWLNGQPDKARQFLLDTISDPQLSSIDNVRWVEDCTLRALETDRESTSQILLNRWQTLPRSVQLMVIEPLTHTAGTMKQLVGAIEAKRVSKDLLNTNQLLKWTASDDAELKSAIQRIWGNMRQEENADRKLVVQRTMELLTGGGTGDPVAGQMHFKRICSQCHRLHGEGVELGPDITGNGRGSFEQLVSNVMDPSLVIGKAFNAKTILTADGRVIAGLVAAEDDQRITIKVQGGKLIELDRKDEIESIKESGKSLMPDGLEQQMNQQELLDLFAYLSLAKPIEAPENATIPGTPEKLVR